MANKILFLETGLPTYSGGSGGSFISLLMLIKRLDSTKYEPYVALSHKIGIINKYEECGCKVYVRSDNLINKLLYQDENSNKNRKSIAFRKGSIFRKVLLLLQFFLNVLFIYRTITRNSIQLIHTNDRISTNIEGIIASKLAGIHCIVHQRQFNYGLPKYFSYFLKHVEFFIANSYAIKNNLTNDLNIDEAKVAVVHNWVDVTAYSNKNGSSRSKEIHSFLWMGRIEEWKGLHILVDLAKLLITRDFRRFTIDVAGEHHGNSEYYSNILSRIKLNNLEQYFNFLGYVELDEIKKNNYDLFIHTSVKPEPFGRVIIEAMQFGIPVLATNMGGVTDIVEDGHNGFLYDPENLTEAADKIIQICQNGVLRKKFVRNGYQTVLEKFNGERQMRTIESIYDNIFCNIIIVNK